MILVSKGLGGRGYDDATVMHEVKPEDRLVRRRGRGVIGKK